MVEERFVEAADVMKRLPEARVRGHYNTWSKILYEFSDLVGQEPPRLTRSCPTADAISRMEETLEWMKWLQPNDAKIVWLRASGERWKAVCWEVWLAPATAHEHWLYVHCATAWKLNCQHMLAGVSKRQVIERTKAVRIAQ